MWKITRWSAIGLVVVSAVLVSARLRTADADGPVAVVVTPAKVFTPGLIGAVADAIDADPAVAKSGRDRLRAAGPDGLAALMSANRQAIAAHVADPKSTSPDWNRLSTAIDAVAAQRNAYASGLYWYTDLNEAESAARASGKPILSLRMLGNLNDEYSCANSRFFRTVLYANSEVASHLRDHFILHWQSVRPVPVVTIDFGDGRVLHRTITGNSIHYVLTADGRVVDGIPGLYGAKSFLAQLTADEAEIGSLGQIASPARQAESLRRFHFEQIWSIESAFVGDVGATGRGDVFITAGGVLTSPTAVQAARRAMCKGIVEVGVVQAIAPNGAAEHPIADADWSAIADRHRADAALDAGSLSLMAAKLPFGPVKGQPPRATVDGFEKAVAEDTVRNQYQFHLAIHRWLAEQPAGTSISLDALNKRVYAELFLTPDSDPWLGLVPSDSYAALDENGVCK